MDTERARPTDRPSEAGLNLLWPGLAQIAQRRRYPGSAFLLTAATVSGVCIYAPESRLVAGLVLAVVATVSLADAFSFERRQRRARV